MSRARVFERALGKLALRRLHRKEVIGLGLLLIILGVLFWLLISSTLGLICVIVGLVLLFTPLDGLRGYSYYRGRRGL